MLYDLFDSVLKEREIIEKYNVTVFNGGNPIPQELDGRDIYKALQGTGNYETYQPIQYLFKNEDVRVYQDIEEANSYKYAAIIFDNFYVLARGDEDLVNLIEYLGELESKGLLVVEEDDPVDEKNEKVNKKQKGTKKKEDEDLVKLDDIV
jgi:hypothetical protein